MERPSEEVFQPCTTGVSSPKLSEAFWFSRPTSRWRAKKFTFSPPSIARIDRAVGAPPPAGASSASTITTSQAMDLAGPDFGASSAASDSPHSMNHAQQPAKKQRIAVSLPVLAANQE